MSKVHFTGIAGVAIAPLAKLMKDLSWEVSGSDENVFEPMLGFLKNNDIHWEEGFVAERVKDADLVILGGAALMKDSNNPEYLEAKRLGKEIHGYAYLIQEYITKENTIVVAGTYGKTTTSAILSWILETAGVNPSFMSGGQPLNFNAGVRRTDSKYSVLEGDEYASVWGYDFEPRFIYYKPNYTLITAAKWDHLNIYPQEEDFVNAFRKLVRVTQENNGVILLASSGENNDKLFNEINTEKYSYSLKGKTEKFKANTHYTGEITRSDKEFTYFTVHKNGELLGKFQTQMIGDHNVENCVGAVAMCDVLGIEMEKVKKGLETFLGIKRRQEIRGKTVKGAIVIDDLAHSPVKAKATLEALRTRFKDEKIFVVFDPHASSLSDRKTLDWYPGTFDLANQVIVPKVSVKKSTPKDERVYGIDIINSIKTTQPNAQYMPEDEMIVNYLKDNCDEKSVIVFMSSGGWRGMIEKLLD